MKLLRRAARELEPSPEAVGRVVRRTQLARALLPAAAAEPSPAAIRRVQAGLRPKPRRLLWVLAVAIALLVVFATRAPHSLSTDLRADVPTASTLTSDVRVTYQGDGAVGGVEQAPVIHWRVGTLETEVEPGKGIRLVVLTDEARVDVKGTIFQVTRSALGTEVSVSRGEVETTCGTEPPRRLVTGTSVLCPPVRASGHLSRARALRRSGAPVEQVLAAIDAGLAVAEPAVRGELLAMKLDVLVANEQDEAALSVADAYLGAGFETRRDEVLAIAAILRAKKSGSDRPPDPSSPVEQQ